MTYRERIAAEFDGIIRDWNETEQMLSLDHIRRLVRSLTESFPSPDDLATEVCLNPNCPRGGKSVTIVVEQLGDRSEK